MPYLGVVVALGWDTVSPSAAQVLLDGERTTTLDLDAFRDTEEALTGRRVTEVALKGTRVSEVALTGDVEGREP